MVNVFSFCLFGQVSAINKTVEYDDVQSVDIVPGGYYDGLTENIRLIAKHYPDWYVYVYLGDDVPEWFAQYLITTYKNVVIRRTGVKGFENTIHRFFAIDEPGVDAMFVRDCDGRIHWRDRWAINYFMKQTRKNLLIIRDHKEHNCMLAGTWGIRKSIVKIPVRSMFASWNPVHCGSGDPNNVRGYGIDQNFLSSVFYEHYADEVLVVHSFDYVSDGEMGVKFPFTWSNDMYVGRIECKPITENFWLRELDTIPPEEFPIVITDKSRQKEPPKPKFTPVWFQRQR